MPSEENIVINVFCSYSDKDRTLQEDLEKHLTGLVREKSVLMWDRHKLKAGQEHQRVIESKIKRADLILLLISSNFISSDDCYAGDLAKALQRHQDHRTHVILILLKPCTWNELAISSFQVLPRNQVPVTLWKNRDAAYTHIVEEIKKEVEELRLFRSGYMEPLHLKAESEALIENSQPISNRRRTSATQRTNTTQRRGATQTNRPRNTLRVETIEPTRRRYFRATPQDYPISLRSAIQEFLLFFFNNLSGRAFKQRCRRWKGKAAVLLAVFVLIDLFLLPYVFYQRSHSAIITATTAILSLFLFASGVCNKENAIGVLFALFYFPIWIVMGLWFLNNYIGLGLSQPSVLLLVLLITLCRLFLFLWRSPFGQR